MTDFDDYSSKPPDPYKEGAQIHPVWRGIGCILVVIIPIMAYILAHELVEGPLLGYIPRELVFTPALPDLGVIPVIWFRYLPAKLLVGAVIALVIFGLLTVLYSVMYGMGGGYRRGATDAAPLKPRKKRW